MHPHRLRSVRGIDRPRAGNAWGVDHDVGAGEELVQARVVGAVDHHAALPGAPRGPVVGERPQSHALRRFHEHDVGSEIGEHPPGRGRRLPSQIDDANTFQQRRSHDSPYFRLPWPSAVFSLTLVSA